MTLETALSRHECDDRIRARLDRRAITLRIDPARPVRGRSSIEGFALRHARDGVIESIGAYIPGASGGTRIDVRYRFAWQSIWWMLPNVVILSVIGGVLLGATVLRPVDADPIAVVVTSTLAFAGFVTLLHLGLFWVGMLLYGPRQRVYLKKFLETTLAAR